MAGFFSRFGNKLFPKHMTKEEFIQKAKEEHGNYYDYSKVRYTDENTRVTVICPKHGKFLITPKEHLEGKGCEQCVNERVDGFLSFINEHATKDSDYDSGLFNNEMLDDIFGTDEDDEEIRYIGKYSDDKTALIECPKDFSGTYVIPDGVEEILTCAFQDCKGLKTVIMPDSVIEIYSNAFCGCTNLKSVQFSEALERIGWKAFDGCSSLTSVIIPDSVKKVDDMAFKGCVNLKTIVLSERIRAIDGHLFEGCTSLKTITIPERVKEIEPYAFKDCTGLTQIIIPEGVEHIHSGAFSGCLNVATISLPESLMTLDANNAGIFEGCDNLREIIVPFGQKQRIADLFEEKDAMYKTLLVEK